MIMVTCCLVKYSIKNMIFLRTYTVGGLFYNTFQRTTKMTSPPKQNNRVSSTDTAEVRTLTVFQFFSPLCSILTSNFDPNFQCNKLKFITCGGAGTSEWCIWQSFIKLSADCCRKWAAERRQSSLLVSEN